ncbi:AraC family transcriptional regulator [Rhizobium sp. S152]|uniref:AraC family transcriptional regulator n=1 Tax=Rhizobium sp. S152 TaxID=3055038 RepID=UPI0025A99B14|nr:AraC family transcriptional regulator [Rhizobium sp. S152]MDM9628988.1 AraC family transcriptional regulator [Rhizobium sp. S152]
MDLRINEENSKLRDATAAVRARLCSVIQNRMGAQEEIETEIEGLTLVRRDHPIPPTPYLYEPSLAMIMQGAKHVVLGESSLWYDESHFLLTAMNLPTITRVVEATPARPYLSMVLKLDLTVAKEIMAALDIDGSEAGDGTAMAVGPATPELFDGVERLLALLDRPKEIPIMSGLIRRELLFRVLTSRTGERLRQIVRIGTDDNRVARAISWLRENYAMPLKVADLADHCHMGVSTLHHHFRVMTAMSPLQFQKNLRLHEARRMLMCDNLDAASAAIEVGYESVTQFNREYRRMFGAPPIRHVRSLRTNAPPSAGATPV